MFEEQQEEPVEAGGSADWTTSPASRSGQKQTSCLLPNRLKPSKKKKKKHQQQQQHTEDMRRLGKLKLLGGKKRPGFPFVFSLRFRSD